MNKTTSSLTEQDFVRLPADRSLADAIVRPSVSYWRDVLRRIRSDKVAIVSLTFLVIIILMGSFVVEQIFAIPGIGAYFVQSIQSLDYTMTLGLTVFFGVFVVSANFVIDLIYGLVDPRIRVAK